MKTHSAATKLPVRKRGEKVKLRQGALLPRPSGSAPGPQRLAAGSCGHVTHRCHDKRQDSDGFVDRPVRPQGRKESDRHETHAEPLECCWRPVGVTTHTFSAKSSWLVLRDTGSGPGGYCSACARPMPVGREMAITALLRWIAAMGASAAG